MSAHHPIRRSVEVEYWVVDSEGRLVEPGPLADVEGTDRECVEPILEFKTTPCETSAELRAELFDRVGTALQRADERRLVPLATPIHATEVEARSTERMRIQTEVVGENFDYVRHCAGTHVHVEQQPRATIDQVNAFIALDPALALLNSSPYYQGEQIAASARSKLYRWMAYEDVPHQGELWQYLDDRREWTRRLERRYEAFEQAARAAGVDRQSVVANFDPESAVWTPVKLREAFGTVEWRSADAALPSDVVQLSDRLARLSDTLRSTDVRIDGKRGSVSEDAVVLPEFDAVLEYASAAVRDGLASDAVRSYLDRMGFEPSAYDPASPTLAGRGDLSLDAARELRLSHAERLERDVRQVRSMADD